MRKVAPVSSSRYTGSLDVERYLHCGSQMKGTVDGRPMKIGRAGRLAPPSRGVDGPRKAGLEDRHVVLGCNTTLVVVENVSIQVNMVSRT